jgi:microcompartment protein PduB
MDQDTIKGVVDAVVQRIGAGEQVEVVKPKGEMFVKPSLTEFVGAHMLHGLGMVIANMEPRLHELWEIEDKYRSIGIIAGRTGAAPQLFAIDEACKATNSELIKWEWPRDTEGNGGHGCLYLIGAEDVSDARRAVEITLDKLPYYFGGIWMNDAGFLELQYSARAGDALVKVLGCELGKAVGLILGCPAGIGVVIDDIALKSAEVNAYKRVSPTFGMNYTNESAVLVTGDSGAIKQAILVARDVGTRLLHSMGTKPECLWESCYYYDGPDK